VSEQSPYNLLERRIENELVPACQRYGLALFTWSPMAMGMLAGRYAAGDAPACRQPGRACAAASMPNGSPSAASPWGQQFALRWRARHGHDPAQLAYLWVKDQPGVTAPIIGPRSLAQLAAGPAGGGHGSWRTRCAQACDALVPPGSVVASFFNSAQWMRWKLV
jgi:aryl-alcohol dehydrogenase-like predicted oxidoreductase